MPAWSALKRSSVAATGVLFGVLAVLPAAPAAACTRVGGFTFGECGPSQQPTSSKPRPTPEELLLDKLNADRTSRGLRALRVDGRAQVMAEEHAQRMADAGAIFHNSRLKTTSGRRRLGYPSRVGENVGVGPDTRSVHAAFMNSPEHRRNLLDRWHRLTGIGAVRKGNSLYVAEIYLTRGGGGHWSASTPHPTVKRPVKGAHTAQGRAAARPDAASVEQRTPWGSFTHDQGPLATGAAGGLGIAATGLWAPAALHGLAHARRRRGHTTRSSAYDLLPDRSTMTVSEARSAALSIESGLSMRRLLM